MELSSTDLGAEFHLLAWCALFSCYRGLCTARTLLPLDKLLSDAMMRAVSRLLNLPRRFGGSPIR